MIGILYAILAGLVFYLVVFVPISAAAHKDVFGEWPKTWQEWLFVWLEPRP